MKISVKFPNETDWSQTIEFMLLILILLLKFIDNFKLLITALTLIWQLWTNKARGAPTPTYTSALLILTLRESRVSHPYYKCETKVPFFATVTVTIPERILGILINKSHANVSVLSLKGPARRFHWHYTTLSSPSWLLLKTLQFKATASGWYLLLSRLNWWSLVNQHWYTWYLLLYFYVLTFKFIPYRIFLGAMHFVSNHHLRLFWWDIAWTLERVILLTTTTR